MYTDQVLYDSTPVYQVQDTPGLGTAYNDAEKHVLIDILSLKTANNPFVVGCHQNGSCSLF